MAHRGGGANIIGNLARGGQSLGGANFLGHLNLMPIALNRSTGRTSLDVQHGDRLVSDGLYLTHKIIFLNSFAENFQK
jgi:hypothetical protein